MWRIYRTNAERLRRPDGEVYSERFGTIMENTFSGMATPLETVEFQGGSVARPAENDSEKSLHSINKGVLCMYKGRDSKRGFLISLHCVPSTQNSL